MNCHDAEDKIQAWLDNDLNANELTETKEHLRLCPECRLRYRMFIELHQRLKHLPLESPSPDFNKAVFGRLGIAYGVRGQPLWMGWSLAGGLSLIVSWLLAMGVGVLMIIKNIPWHQLLSWVRHPQMMLNNMEQVLMSLGLNLYHIFNFAAKVAGWLPASQLPLQMLFSSLLAMGLIALAMYFLKPIDDFVKP